MKIASVAEIKARLSSFLDASAEGPVVVTRNGKAVAVLVGVEDDDELESLLFAHSTKLRAILNAAERRIEDGAGVNHEEFWRQVDTRAQAGKKNSHARSKRKSLRDKPKRG